ncbi:uncharacterized protein BO97DRAFT_398360 [Aspergillus homomorphus CBS 101889]|uniref:MOZ protein represents a chromatin-associated acetyltransferase n=1 Tax=Aspergillus homomorphus (strain CBS 101889) TaxID=1450537 RepID=A0A395HM60_ASPHC|nr:hypothetical protein BO97DRAFT_398360 [Aspergillus homomorphus CBS 101889]RAL08315.1 hypothetical protein BO97DRAFT_398360 [Aspergillus homomorphus CBS 101889]
MATPRLPFLYPNLMRAVRSCEPTTYRSIRAPYSSSQQAPFHTSRRYAPETYHRRYGPAAEPNLPPPSKPKDGSSQKQAPAPSGQEASAPNPAPQEQSSQKEEPAKPSESSSSRTKDSASASGISSESKGTADKAELEFKPEPKKDIEPTISDHQDAAPTKEAVPIFSNNNNNNNERPSSEEPQYNPHILKQNPLEGVLHMPSPSSYLTTGGGPVPDPTSNPPNLSPAPYVHYFDTYSLVRDLSKSGFSDEQSITIMKAVRSILQSNLDLAKQSLTSKSDVENESYLFQAACSELQSSLQTARTSEMQRQRASRTQLQHEADILSQRLNQELAGLKDDIKGMFNDHKMSTREQQRNIDTSVQELNYKITVSLNSDGKSEIEGLRWILTRRAAMAIATSAFMIILFLKYYSIRKGEEKSKKKTEQPAAEAKASRVITPDPAHRPKSTTPPTVIHLGESLG